MKRITRDRRLTPEEADKYARVREHIAQELPDLLERHHRRMTGPEEETPREPELER